MGGKWPKTLSPKDGFKKFILGIKHELARLCFVLHTQSSGNFWEKVEHFGIIFGNFGNVWIVLKITSYNLQSRGQIMILGRVHILLTTKSIPIDKHLCKNLINRWN